MFRITFILFGNDKNYRKSSVIRSADHKNKITLIHIPESNLDIAGPGYTKPN